MAKDKRFFKVTETYDSEHQLSIFNFLWAFGKAAGLSAISFSASFLPAQKSLPNFTFPVPESQFPPLLQKDAAPIPNAWRLQIPSS